MGELPFVNLTFLIRAVAIKMVFFYLFLHNHCYCKEAFLVSSPSMRKNCNRYPISNFISSLSSCGESRTNGNNTRLLRCSSLPSRRGKHFPSFSRSSSSNNNIGRTSSTLCMNSIANENNNENNKKGDYEVIVTFDTKKKSQEIIIQKGEILRTALMKRGISPHNGNSRLINCRGLGTCGTCAVEVTRMNSSIDNDSNAAIEPAERTMKESLRLNFPPHGSEDQSSNLRLACQIQVNDDIIVRKKAGFWGQSDIEDDLALDFDAKPYFGDLEYILDDKSPSK